MGADKKESLEPMEAKTDANTVPKALTTRTPAMARPTDLPTTLNNPTDQGTLTNKVPEQPLRRTAYSTAREPIPHKSWSTNSAIVGSRDLARPTASFRAATAMSNLTNSSPSTPSSGKKKRRKASLKSPAQHFPVSLFQRHSRTTSLGGGGASVTVRSNYPDRSRTPSKFIEL